MKLIDRLSRYLPADAMKDHIATYHETSDEIGDCLLWTGHMPKDIPTISYLGKPTSVRRVLAEVVYNQKIPSMWSLRSACIERNCVSLHHTYVHGIHCNVAELMVILGYVEPPPAAEIDYAADLEAGVGIMPPLEDCMDMIESGYTEGFPYSDEIVAEAKARLGVSF